MDSQMDRESSLPRYCFAERIPHEVHTYCNTLYYAYIDRHLFVY